MKYRIPAEYLTTDTNATYVENGPNYDVTIEEAHLDVQITPRRKYKGYKKILRDSGKLSPGIKLLI